MSIKHAILGLLSWKSSTGYELKKIFEESTVMYWSGNNNQIYKALVQLLEEGFVSSETIHQESSPSKKIYSITSEGIAELKEWILSSPEAPDFKKPFLIQLAWADLLSNEELEELLVKYETEIKMQLLIQKEKIKRGGISPTRSPREIFLWNKISQNLISSYENELEWIRGMQREFFEKVKIEERYKMNYAVIEKDTKRYVEIKSVINPLCTEQDAVDLVALCIENASNLIMIHHDALSEDFFKLKTGIAGKMLQKFINYNIKTAAIIPSELANKGRFREMVLETNKGSQFRVFQSKEDAENWLLNN